MFLACSNFIVGAQTLSASLGGQLARHGGEGEVARSDGEHEQRGDDRTAAQAFARSSGDRGEALRGQDRKHAEDR